jgi:hypothetical protein
MSKWVGWHCWFTNLRVAIDTARCFITESLHGLLASLSPGLILEARTPRYLLDKERLKLIKVFLNTTCQWPGVFEIRILDSGEIPRAERPYID